MSKREEATIGQILWEGINQKVGTYTVTVLARNPQGHVLCATGDDPPEDGDAGFATGCIFICPHDGLMGSNFGDETSSEFWPYVPLWFFFM
jgi:hypothetical protein